MTVTTAYEKTFGQKAADTKKKGKRQVKKAEKRECQVIKKLQAKRNRRYVRAIVACGLAFKADLKLKYVQATAIGDRLGEQYFKDKLSDSDLRWELERNAAVRHRAKKKLARKGVRLNVGYDTTTFSCSRSLL